MLNHHVVTKCFKGVPACRGLVGEVCQGVGVGLRVVEVVHAGQLPPAGVTPDLDQDYYYDYHYWLLVSQFLSVNVHVSGTSLSKAPNLQSV